jgi:hypothetical protein
MIKNSEVETLGTMHVDEETTRVLLFEVSEALKQKLDDQRQRLDGVNPKLPPVERYQLARSAGVLAAVAKGVKNRSDRPNEIFLPKSELRNGNGSIRISSLRAAIAVPEGVRVKSVSFVRTDGAWQGRASVTN